LNVCNTKVCCTLPTAAAAAAAAAIAGARALGCGVTGSETAANSCGMLQPAAAAAMAAACAADQIMLITTNNMKTKLQQHFKAMCHKTCGSKPSSAILLSSAARL
jgi:hypothetical protein